MEQLKYLMNVFLVVIVSCTTNSHSLKDNNHEDLIRGANLFRSLSILILDNDINFSTYNIYELGFSIRIPDRTIIIKRNACYQKGVFVELPEPFKDLQNTMFVDNEYLIGIDSFGIRIIHIPYSDDFLEDDFANTNKIEKIVKNKLQQDTIFLNGLQKHGNNIFLVFYNETNDSFYFTIINNIPILLCITNADESFYETISNILESITEATE